MKGGAKTWYFSDGYLPEQSSEGKLQSHEALMLFNTGSDPAHVKLDFYFENKEPAKDIPVTIGAERVACLRLDKPEQIGGLKIPPLTQYAIRVRSNVHLVAQFGRLDATQVNLAYYGSTGHCED